MYLAMNTSVKGFKENDFYICVKPSSYEVQTEFIKFFPAMAPVQLTSQKCACGIKREFHLDAQFFFESDVLMVNT